jgi:sphinganine-1-phosphate aldolase
MKADNDSNGAYMLDPSSVAPLVGPNTILIYASAPSFPQGIIDPVRALSNIAVQYGIGLHVDCCLGGFILPFARYIANTSEDGRYSADLMEKCRQIPVYDFDLEGVTSMSVDTHKYGYTLKGTSVVLYKNRKLRRYQVSALHSRLLPVLGHPFLAVFADGFY